MNYIYLFKLLYSFIQNYRVLGAAAAFGISNIFPGDADVDAGGGFFNCFQYCVSPLTEHPPVTEQWAPESSYMPR